MLHETYPVPGGLATYIERSRKLLAESQVRTCFVLSSGTKEIIIECLRQCVFQIESAYTCKSFRLCTVSPNRKSAKYTILDSNSNLSTYEDRIFCRYSTRTDSAVRRHVSANRKKKNAQTL